MFLLNRLSVARHCVTRSTPSKTKFSGHFGRGIRRASTKPTFLRRTFYKDNGKISKGAVAAAAFSLWALAACASLYSFNWNKEDPRIILSNIVAKSLCHVDRHAFSTTDFYSFESTMAYFKSCVLISEWAMAHGNHMFPRQRGRLQLEDLVDVQDKVDAKFAALLAMPEGQEKNLYHAKVRLACQDIHRFLQDFNSLSEDEIEILCNKPVHELTKDQRMAVAGIGFGTNMLIRVTWWAAPV